jgi:hypothetical protein
LLSPGKIVTIDGMFRTLILLLVLFVGSPVGAQGTNPPVPPLTGRNPLPGPYFFYFENGSTELDERQLEYLRNIPKYWNDGDGGSVICSPAFLTGPARDTTRSQQLDHLKSKLASVGITQLFLTFENCPVDPRSVTPAYTVFAIYGVGRL